MERDEQAGGRRRRRAEEITTGLTDVITAGACFELPPRIFLYRGPLTRMCADLEELRREVQITVVHEVAHHFGIDDQQLHEWGWG